MKITLDFSEEQLARFGIVPTDTPEEMQEKFDKACSLQTVLSFDVTCNDTIENYEGVLWEQGREYHAEFYGTHLLATSEQSKFCQTYMAATEFTNYFDVRKVSPETAKIMFNKGYEDMFEMFLKEEERPELRHFKIKPKSDICDGGLPVWTKGFEYKVSYSPLSQAFIVETDPPAGFVKNGKRKIRDFSYIDAFFSITEVSAETAKSMSSDGFGDAFKKFEESRKPYER